MKINEITQPSEDKALFEELDASNNSGFSTEDMFKIIKTRNDPRGSAMSGDEFDAYIDALTKKHG